jgi:hypothetical protein
MYANATNQVTSLLHPVTVWLLLVSLLLSGCGDSGVRATKPDTTVRVSLANNSISVKGGLPGQQFDGTFPLPAKLEELTAVLGEPDRTVDEDKNQILVWDKHGITAGRKTSGDPVHKVCLWYHDLVVDYDPRRKFSGEVTIADYTLTPLTSSAELKEYGYVRPTMLPIYECRQLYGNVGVTLITGEFDRGEFIKQIMIHIPTGNTLERMKGRES